MIKRLGGLAAVLLLLCGAISAYGEDKVLTMSTTTSTESSGLLDVLLPALKKDTGIEVKVIAKGTGAALRDGMDGNVDVVFVHAREREEQFVAEGYGTRRYGVMHNDFVIIGPKEDPAGVAKTRDVNEALQAIARHGAGFISRGDDSGTHTKEQALWQQSGVPVEKVGKTIVKSDKQVEIAFIEPAGAAEWYRSIGQGMGKTLTYADEKRAYTLTDRGTYISYIYGKTPPIDLDILSEGSAGLANYYGVIPVNPEKFGQVKYDLARQFAEWLTSKSGQQVIADYQLHGKQLFYPDARP